MVTDPIADFLTQIRNGVAAGKAEIIAADLGFAGGADPVALDADSVARVGAEVIARAHPALNWQVQFAHARAIGFGDMDA